METILHKRSLRVTAPAKTNLTLKVLRRRDDGFHEIETRMIPLGLRDDVHLKLIEPLEIQFRCVEPGVPRGADNLAVQAAQTFLERVDVETGVRIELTKRVPMGAGLGGGSSDAAAVLRGLNTLLETGLEREELADLAAELGSDVPFFVHEQACVCRGRGELVEPAPMDRELPILLARPPFPIPTPWAYSRWEDSKEIPGVLYAPQVTPWGEMVNDLERPVFEKHLVLANLKMWLLEQRETQASLLSGSGSTMLAVLRNPAMGEGLAERIKAEFGEDMWVWW